MANFKTPFRLTDFSIQFQGGFAAKRIEIQFYDDKNNLLHEKTLFCEDINLKQQFADLCNEQCFAKLIKFNLCECSDFFGRVIVYDLQLRGCSL